MRSSIRTALLSVAALISAPLFAQNPIGTWQGTLPDGPMPRVIVRFNNGPDGKLRAFLARPDRWGTDSLPMASARLDGEHLKLEFGMFDISFDGTFAPDGKTLSGTWSENKQACPLTLRLTAPDDLWIKPSAANNNAMDPHADPSFEVATIKPSDGKTPHRNQMRTHNFQTKNSSVFGLINLVFDLRERQIEGAPAWFKEDHFDIDAIADTPGNPSEEQDRIMLRKLLAERFGLKFHMVKRDFPVLALRVDKLSTAVTPADNTTATHGNILLRQNTANTDAVVQHMDMHELCGLLMNYIPERQVVDETGISGRYDFTVHMPPDIMQRPDQTELANAVLDGVKALGFRLESTRAQLDVMIIDYIDKPSAN